MDLASLTDSMQIPKLLVKTLGIYEAPNQPLMETITSYLRSSRLLLVLDNCEHLVATIAALAETLLSECQGLIILTTSREALGLFGETIWNVPSLPYPETPELPSVQGFLNYASIKLFVERAKAADPGFSITPRNAVAVAQICQKLDGLPLAIELAAARVKLLTVEEVESRLVDRFSLLTGGSRTALPRQQTLRASIDWSYGLLAAPEQKLYRSLSVFTGSFTMEAAREVAFSDLQATESCTILDELTQLVSKSLINVEHGPKDTAGETRYRMLETIREYAREKLEKEAESEIVHSRFLTYCINLAERAKPKLKSQEQVEWLNRLELEQSNFSSALEWSVGRKQAEEATRLILAVDHFWYLRGYYQEEEKWVTRIQAIGGYPLRTQARLLMIKGNIARLLGFNEHAIASVQASLDFFQAENDIPSIAEAKGLLGIINVLLGKREQGIQLLEDSLEIFRDIGDEWQIARILLYLADTYNRMGKNDNAIPLSRECLAKFKGLGDPWGITFASGIAGEIARQQGNYREAKDFFRHDLSFYWQVGHLGEVPYPMETLSIIAILEKDFKRAVRLWGAAEAFREKNHIPLPSAYRDDYQLYLSMAREALGESAFIANNNEGRNLDMEQAVTLAMQDSMSDQATQLAIKPVPTIDIAEGENIEAYGLTPREVDVLRLVMTGLTDAQVAERLFLSPRTVSKHLQSVYNKLHVNSRTAATRFAFDRHWMVGD